MPNVLRWTYIVIEFYGDRETFCPRVCAVVCQPGKTLSAYRPKNIILISCRIWTVSFEIENGCVIYFILLISLMYCLHTNLYATYTSIDESMCSLWKTSWIEWYVNFSNLIKFSQHLYVLYYKNYNWSFVNDPILTIFT